MHNKIILFVLLMGFFAFSQAQTHQISGTVKEQDGTTLPGVNIVEKGTTIGAVSDIDGRFQFSVSSPDAVLVVSFIGYKTLEIPLEGRNQLTIELLTAARSLSEVVVVGYGSQRRESVVGAISVARVDEIENIAAANLSNSIGGRISGVISRGGEGQPGNDDATLLIRGRSTTNDASPLVLVDGMESSLNRINPSDIESFSILKDASATAVYGVRGANGVILITTKRGREGVPQINVNSQFRMHSVIGFPNFVNSYDYARLYNEAIWNGGSDIQFYSDEDLELYRTGESPFTHPDIDWFDLMVRPMYPEHRHDISFRGGTSLVRYFISGEFVDQEGAFRQFDNMKYSTNNAYNRINLRSNLDFNVTRSTVLRVNMSGRRENIHAPNSGDFFGSGRTGFWDNIFVTRPNAYAPVNPDGSFGNSFDARGVELGYMHLRQGGYRNLTLNTFEGNLRLEQNLDVITKGLNARMIYGLTLNNGYAINLNERPASFVYNGYDSTFTPLSTRSLPSYSTGSNRSNQIEYIETAFNYERNFNNAHDVSGLFLFNTNRRTIGSTPPASQLGFAGRLTYGYRNRYFAEFNAGYNGSDQFQTGERFAFLPAGSIGWSLSEEEFFNVDFINHLKFRASYGTVANDRIGGYRYLYESFYDRFASSPRNERFRTGYFFGTNPEFRPHIQEGTLGNDFVTWEVAVKQNAGIDLWLFDSSVSIAIDFFQEYRRNILARRNTVTADYGISQNQLPPENIGEVENKGFEVELRTSPSIGQVKLNLSGNFSYARNERIFFDEVLQRYDYMMATGRPIGQYFGYTWTGEFYTHEELGYVWSNELGNYILPDDAEPTVPVPDDGAMPGDLKFVDRNGDGVIDSYDVGYIGKSNIPEYVYGFNIGFEYRGFSVNSFWQGAGGFTNDNHYVREFVNGAKAHEIHLDRWAYFPELGIDTRETATYPRLGIDGTAQTRKWSSFRTFPGDYLRLKNLEVGYSLPGRWIERVGMSSARIYITGTNLVTFSELDYIDPEAPQGTASFYPQSRYYGAGLSVSF